MCGIAGVIYHDRSARVDAAVLSRMCSVMIHRGPDDEGIYTDGNFGFGMRRLSIIDLAGGHQPVHNEDETIWVISNGEIYNYVELRKDLEAQGHRFYTQSDTEVLVHAYEQHGDEMVHLLNGMYGFAIWDGRRRRLLIVRDRLGIKPVLYAQTTDRLIFASEAKAIFLAGGLERNVDPVSLHHYLSLNYVPAPRSMFAGVRKLLPGHYMVYQDGKLTTHRYWELNYDHKLPADLDERAEQALALFNDSIRLRLRSDVPVGVLLSGGIDSSAITALAALQLGHPLETFTVGYSDESHNEMPYANMVAQRYATKHHPMVVEPRVAELFERIMWHLEEPFADYSALPTYAIAQLCRQHVTVVLCGEGGDECYAGYETYGAWRMSRLYKRLPALLGRQLIPALANALPVSRKKVSFEYRAKRFVRGALMHYEPAHYEWKVIFTEQEKRRLYDGAGAGDQAADGWPDTYADSYGQTFAHAPATQELDRLLYCDTKVWLANNCLVKMDRMTMAHSLEGRLPFLDHRCVEFCASLTPQLKMKRGTKKYLLKHALRDKLPREAVHRRKQGFGMPLNQWLDGELQGLCWDLLGESRTRQMGFFKPAETKRLIEDHVARRADYSRQIWNLLCFVKWHQLFVEPAQIPMAV